MTQLYVSKGLFPKEYFGATVDYIAAVQCHDGGIPWYEDGTLDPWDHVEAAMGLSIGGLHQQAQRAFYWLAEQQRRDGSWLAAYKDGAVVDGTRAETNFVAYVATGIWHHYLINPDTMFLQDMWPVARAAMEFIADLQTPHGEVYWALDTRTGINKDALITGCSSIYKSLECMANICVVLGKDPRGWLLIRERLGDAIRNKPERFDRTWPSKSRYSMDWFYPVLTGVLEGEAARRRLRAQWDRFVEKGMGCRCVAEEPWVTVAETCELTLALTAAGETQRATEVFSWLHDYRAADGSWWTGYALRDQVLWPEERPTWTAGAVLLAGDALAQHTRANRLFTEVRLPPAFENSEGSGHLARLEQP
ncbi:MAG: prenyltransferase [Gammaproteobacteria bacterium]|nr:MAG: prenyltransferase [Gammaproteobacteria bacterium]